MAAARKAIVFLGGGRITAALLAGLRLAHYRGPIVVHDRNPHKLRALQKQYGVSTEPDLTRAVSLAGLLIVAVRPSDVLGLLERIRPMVAGHVPHSPGKKRVVLACSLAAGIPLVNLRAALGPPVRWSRAMPSPVARAGRGLTAVAFERVFPRAGRKLVEQFFARVGSVLEVPESKFDAFMVTFSPSHGYHALTALAQAGTELGLTREAASLAATHALADGIVAWREGKESLAELLREAATPGGIAAAVMNAMNAAGHARVIRRGLQAGVVRARKNATASRPRSP
jgi:pyrroline-5-carboxylate reductase